MMVLNVNFGKKTVFNLCYPGGDAALHGEIYGIAKSYVGRFTAAYPNFLKSVTIMDNYFEKPLKSFTPTTFFGKLSPCHAPEVYATAVVLQRAIAQAIARWEADHEEDFAEPEPPPPVVPPQVSPSKTVVVPREIDFHEIDHPHDDYWEGREDPS